jgi:hypothetical protein
MSPTDDLFSRRGFMKAAAIGIAAATVGEAQQAANAQSSISAAPAVPATRPSPTIGIQFGTASFLRRNFDEVLDNMQKRGGVNALFPFIYSHVGTSAGFPDANFRGGNFAIPHMQFYKDTVLSEQDMRAPEAGNIDVLEKIIQAASKRGMKTFAWVLEDNRRVPLAAWDTMYEVDFQGRRAQSHPSGPCYNNPAYRAYVLGLMEDYSRSYEIDGVMWSSERQGGLFNALGAWHHGQVADPGQATCFCEFCVKKAKDQGIDAERARAGFVALEKFVRDGRARKRPRDGYFVTFMRILLNHPELLAWESLWIRSRGELMAAIHQKVKSIKPAMQVGWHIWHNVSFSPFHRAEMDFGEIAKYSDYIKPVLYSNCAGERMKSFADSVRGNVFGDMPAAENLDMLYHMLDYREAPYDKISASGFTPDYVERETRRTVDDVGGAAQVWPGIDIDVPVPAGASRCTPEYVKQTVLSAFKGGATGVILSRNYEEMNLENLAGAGAAVEELRKTTGG